MIETGIFAYPLYAGVTQLVEYLPSKQAVARSSRVARSISSKYKAVFRHCSHRVFTVILWLDERLQI